MVPRLSLRSGYVTVGKTRGKQASSFVEPHVLSAIRACTRAGQRHAKRDLLVRLSLARSKETFPVGMDKNSKYLALHARKATAEYLHSKAAAFEALP